MVGMGAGADSRPGSSPEEVLAALDGAIGVPLGPEAGAEAVLAVAGHAAAADERLRGVSGVRALLARPDLRAAVIARLDVLDGRVAAIEERLGSEAAKPAALEALNPALVTVRDALWAIRRDRLRTADAVLDFGGRDAGAAAVAAYTAVQMALSAIDRLEVRGRDSAG